MTTATLRRFALALSTGAMILLALTLTAARPQAQTSDHPPTCGGRDQVPCTVFSVFWNENFGVCDRGLKVDFLANRCINSTRRQGKGSEFRSSWTGRALRIQQDQLNWDKPVGTFPMLMARNAYQNEADGYAGSAQFYSMTELLDAGVRALRLEVHASVDSSIQTGTYPKMCMSMSIAHGPIGPNDNHGGCVITDRWFANGLREIRDWMVEPGHEREVVFLIVDLRVDQGGKVLGGGTQTVYDKDKVLAPLEEYFANDSRIGLLKETDDGVNSLAATFPSRAWMAENGKRVAVLSSTNNAGLVGIPGGGWREMLLVYPIGFGLNEFTGAYPACTAKRYPDLYREWQSGNPSITTFDLPNGKRRIMMLDGEDFTPTEVLDQDFAQGTTFASHYPTYRAPTATDLRNVMKCNVTFLGLNKILDPAQDPDRVRGIIWSFADDEPIGAGPGNGALLHASDGRWRVRAVSTAAAHVCYASDGTWKISTAHGALTDGINACSAIGASFVPPHNGNQNEKARAAVAAAGQADAWVNYVALGADEWTTANEPSIVAWDLASIGGIYAGVKQLFSLAWNVAATSVEWTFGDGTATVNKAGGNVFPDLIEHTFEDWGPYTVTARIHIGASEKTISRTFEVKQLSDLPFGPQITLLSAPANVVEGGDMWLSVRSRWPVAGARCRPGAPITAPASTEIRTDLEQPAYDAQIVCQTKGGDSPRVDVEVVAYMPNPDTGEPIIDPATGQFASMSKHFLFDVPNVAPVIGTFTGPADPKVYTPTSFALTLDDAAGEPLTVTVNWPSGLGTEVLHVTPGVLNLSHVFTVASTAPQHIKISVSDGEVTREQTYDVTVSANPVEIVSKTGPTTVDAAPTVSRHYDMIVKNNGGGSIVGLSGSCGTGVRTGGPTFVQEFPDGSDQYGMVCRFSTPGVTTVSMTFENSFGLKATGTIDVTVTGPAQIVTKTGPATVEAAPTTSRRYEMTVRDDANGSIVGISGSCGTGIVKGGPSFVMHSADGTALYAMLCRFSTPGPTVVSITFENSLHLMTTGTIDVMVTAPDTTAPVIFVPSPISVEAKGPSTAVTYPAVTATDNVDGPVAVTCDMASGAGYPVGTTTVTCTAKDAATNPASKEFTITVTDTTPPAVAVPSAIAKDATSSAGAPVTFTVSASDLVDGARPVSCNFESGATFPVGVTTVKCSASDTRNNTSALKSFTVTIGDSAAPVVTVPAPITAEAAAAAGAAVTFSVSATDAIDGARPVNCNYTSGAIFPLGVTTVKCTATDAHNNTSAEASFTVTIVDTLAPFVTVPAPISAEASAGGGAPVTYSVSAIDAVDGARPVNCNYASGVIFPLGVTTVKCTATDAHNNTSAPSSFTVTVADTTAPAFLGASPNLVVDATSAQGAAVTYTVPQATDAVGVTARTCSPASGSMFGVGTTTVACSASDAAGNRASRSFTVTVRGASEQVAALQAAVVGVGPGKSLKGQADAAAQAIAAGNKAGAIAALTDLINHVKAQSGKSIPAAQAAALIAQAEQAIAALR